MRLVRRPKLIVAALLVLALGLALPGLAEACPNCKDTIAGDDPSQNLARGFYYSILFMLSMPFLIVGTFGGCMYLAVRRARAAQQAEAERKAE